MSEDVVRESPLRRVTVLGAGSWGTTFAKILADAGREVTLWARREEIANEINTHRSLYFIFPLFETKFHKNCCL